MKIATVVLLVCQVGMTWADAQCSDSLGNCPKPRGSLMQLKTLKQNQKTQLASNITDEMAKCPMGEFRYFETSALSIHIRTAIHDHEICAVVGIAIRSLAYRRGAKYMSIVTSVSKRIQIYDGGARVIWPTKSTRKRSRMLQKSISGVLLRMTPVVTLEGFDLRVDLHRGAILRISEKNGALTLGVLKWPAETDEAEGLISTYDDQDCYIHKEAVLQKEDSFFRRLASSNDFHNFNHPLSFCSVPYSECDDQCASFAFPGLKVLGRMALEARQTPEVLG